MLFGDVGKPLGTWRHKAGAAKVLQDSLTALALGHRHLWIDSCCIDKTSSVKARLVESSFLETSYQTLNIEVTTARGGPRHRCGRGSSQLESSLDDPSPLTVVDK